MTKSAVTYLNSKGLIIDGPGNYQAHWEGCCMHVGAHGREQPLHSTATSPILGSQKLTSLTSTWKGVAERPPGDAALTILASA